jgi:hypothetical protein
MKLIDKDALVAEIKKMLDKYNKLQSFNYGAVKDLEHLLNFLDTLEVKEVDLEKEFDKCCENYIFDDECEVYTARHFFELGLKAQ